MCADKGNATVIMDREDYTKKARDIIEYHPFERVKRDPTRKLEREVNKCLWDLHQKGHILRPLYNKLHASCCSLPRFYGRVKVHKPGMPLRPVISTTESAVYALSKYLAGVLEPFVAKPNSRCVTVLIL